MGVLSVIEFLCPNGHHIRCQAEQAGRAAKCPRCGVKFRIPKATDEDVSEAGNSDSKFPRPEFIESTGSSRKLPGSTSAGQAAAAADKKEAEIEFLCPNGHRLHGASSLQGRPGACPECGSRFRIPTYENITPEEETEHEINLGYVDGREGSDAKKRSPEETQRRLPSIGNGESESSSPLAAVFNQAKAAQAMAALVIRLWDTRPAGTTVELRLRDGETIVPERFLKRLSQESLQGVFAVKETDGNLSLAAVAWDAVARVSVRGLSELPDSLKE
jgi:DNA-directed RNA polymerase subunit RPC12/RpoP